MALVALAFLNLTRMITAKYIVAAITWHVILKVFGIAGYLELYIFEVAPHCTNSVTGFSKAIALPVADKQPKPLANNKYAIAIFVHLWRYTIGYRIPIIRSILIQACNMAPAAAEMVCVMKYIK